MIPQTRILPRVIFNIDVNISRPCFKLNCLFSTLKNNVDNKNNLSKFISYSKSFEIVYIYIFIINKHVNRPLVIV